MSLPRIAVRGAWCVLALVLSASVAHAEAREQGRQRSRGASRARVVHARPGIVARQAGPIPIRVRPISPLARVGRYGPYFHRPGFGVGVSFGPRYPYDPYSYGHRHRYGYPYPYGHPYTGPVHVRPSRHFGGGVRFDVRQRDAAVYVDGYYAGIVDDFDGAFRRLEIEPGPHRIELGLPGYETLAFDVNVRPGETIRYHGDFERLP